MTHRLCRSSPLGRREIAIPRAEPNGEARPCQYGGSRWEPCVDFAPPIHGPDADAATLIENGDRAGPAGGSGPHLDRKAAHLEAGRRQPLQIVQLLHMPIADLPPALVPLLAHAPIAALA